MSQAEKTEQQAESRDVIEHQPHEVAQSFNGASPVQSIAQIVASGASTEVVDQMIKLVEWNDKREAEAAFNAAFSKARKEFKEAKKSGYNSHLDSKYSLLEDYDEATREALSNHGLAWRHVPATLDGNITSVTCILSHELGHHETCEMRAPSHSMTNKAVNELQSVGIVTTYLKRITLASMLGLVSDSEFDNDGNGGKQGDKTQQPPNNRPQAKPHYPDDKFDNMLPQWRELVETGGKTAQSVLTTISSKYELSEKQKKTILSLKPKQEEANA